MNGGWIQVMGPLGRIDQFKQIETTMFGGNLQQSRWPPTNIADSAEEALARMVMLPGAHYSDPEFSWKFEVAPAGIGFMDGRGLGPQYDGDLFVGAARDFLEDGFLWHFNLTGNRRKIAVDDPRLEDRVADNLGKPAPGDPAANAQALVESESLLFGRDFGVVTDIRTGPNGNLFVVSLSDGVIYEIFRVRGGGGQDRDDDNRGRGHGRRGDDDRGHGNQGHGPRPMAADFGAIGAGSLGAVQIDLPGGDDRSGVSLIRSGDRAAESVSLGDDRPAVSVGAVTVRSAFIGSGFRTGTPDDDPLSLDPVVVG
jgi:hypothetical protein